MTTRARWTLVLGIGAALLTAATPAAAKDYRLHIGDAMPDLELPRLEGGRLRLHSLRGSLVVVSFYSPYCEPCERELPVLKRVVERVARDTRAAIVTVIIVTEGRPAAELVKQHAAARWLVDEKDRARSAFDPRTLPCTFLIDQKGTVRHINRGFGSGYEQRVEKWLRAMAAAKGR
jgi:cytochrome c biogenesis protein CcmG/thiol:disulfide interchange protein DsbE